MQYAKAFTFAVKKPKTGWLNILLGLVCLLIPVVGQVAWLGYRGHVASDLDEDPDLRYHRDFEFGKFGEYLTKGIWQFLAQLLLGCIAMIAYVGMFVGMATVGKNDPDMMLAVFLGGYALVFVLVVIGTFFVWPLEIYAALSEKVRVGRAFSFAGHFARVMWGQMLVVLIVYFVLSWLTMMLGLAACCFGIFPAAVIVSSAEVHLLVQLYQSYLDKGGTPIRDLNAVYDVADED